MRFSLYLGAIILFTASLLYAKDVPPSKGYVSDYAGLLTSSEAQTLDQKLRDYDNKTSTQIVVLIIKSLEGESIESFGIKVAEKWKPGQKGKDNGAIFIISIDDHKTRIEVGYGLEATLTDLVCSVILNDTVKPKFRQGKYYEGIDGAIDNIIAAIKGEFTATKASKWSNILINILVVFVFLLFVVFRLLGPLGIMSVGGWSTGSSWGGGFSGGFSGGGGGFGGGGASGGW